jgi:hypothetical protein
MAINGSAALTLARWTAADIREDERVHRGDLKWPINSA